MKSSCCIKNNCIKIIILSMGYSSFGNINRLLVSSHREYFNALFITINSKLFNGCWSVYITGN